MIKIIFSAFITVIVGRWMYAEAVVMAPGFVPYIDAVLEKTSIPTHDQWSKDSVEQLYRKVANVYKVASDAWETTSVANASNLSENSKES